MLLNSSYLRKIINKKADFLLSYHKVIWRVTHHYAQNSTPVFIFGVQRSGTSIFGKCLGISPEIKYYPEHNTIAFQNFKLKNSAILKMLIKKCPYKAIAFKPLTDSHRVVELITSFGASKAIWMYRRYQDRVNSAVAKFGRHNLDVLTSFSQGCNLDIWQAQGLTEESMELIKSFDYNTISPEEASSIFWYIRNSLFFDQGLHKRDDVICVAYEDFVNNPDAIMKKICVFLNCRYYPAMVRSIHSQSIGLRKEPEVTNRIHKLCVKMYQLLEEIRLEKEAKLTVPESFINSG